MEWFATLSFVWQIIIGFCAGVATIGGAVSIFIKIKKPWATIKAQIAQLFKQNEELKLDLEAKEKAVRHDLEDVIKDTRTQMCAINSDVERTQEDMKVIMKSLFAIGDHFITGNGEDQIKAANNDIRNHLINKNGS